MGLLQEFKTFIVKGNAIDLAVGIIIGAAFGAVVNSLVKDVIMPPIGWAMAGIDFSQLKIPLPLREGMTEPASINYGMMINALIALLIQGFAVFLIIKAINSMKKKEEAAPSAPPAPTKDQVLLTEIRDLLSRR
jgi:large conductance mechanosensitive channel